MTEVTDLVVVRVRRRAEGTEWTDSVVVVIVAVGQSSRSP